MVNDSNWVCAGAKVGKLCSDAAIDAAIVKGDTEASWGAHCFNKCSPADQKNTTSECWIECFYNNVSTKVPLKNMS